MNKPIKNIKKELLDILGKINSNYDSSDNNIKMLISSLNKFFILYNEVASENDNLKKQNQNIASENDNLKKQNLNNSVIIATNCYSYGCFI
jgi:hypothetical protein